MSEIETVAKAYKQARDSGDTVRAERYAGALVKMRKGSQAATAGSFNTPNPPNQFNSLSHPMQNADMTTGAPAGLRAATSIKSTEAGQENYLKSKIGDKNVYRREDGELFINQGKGWLKFDEKGVSLRDMADMAGGAIETVPALAAGVATGANPFGAAAGQAAGSTLRHGISGMMDGDDEISLGARAADVAGKSAIAGASQLGINKLFAPVFDKMRPHNIVANQVAKTMAKPYAVKGQALSNKTGVPFSVGQTTGNKSQLLIEGMARRHPMGGDIVGEFDEQALKAAKFNLDTQLNRLGRSNGSTQAGLNLADSFKTYKGKLFSVRSKQANADMEAVTAQYGDTPMFSVNNLVQEIDDIVAKYNTPLGSDNASKVLDGLYDLRKTITGSPQATPNPGSAVGPVGSPQLVLTPRQMQRTLQIYGDAARGKDKLIPGIDDLTTSSHLSKRLFNALNRDLDNIADANDAFGGTAQALQKFRNNYRVNSGKIAEAEQSTLGRLLGGRYQPDPDVLVEKFVKGNMKPTQIRETMAILDDVDPLVSGDIKRQMVERLMVEGRPSASAQIPGATQLSPARFNTAFRKQEENIRAAFTRKEYADIKRVSKAMERLSYRAGTDGSPTAPLMWAADLANGLMSVNPVNVARTVVASITPKEIAKAMTTAEGRKVLTGILTTKPTTKAVEAASVYFVLNGSGTAQQ